MASTSKRDARIGRYVDRIESTLRKMPYTAPELMPERFDDIKNACFDIKNTLRQEPGHE